MAKLQNNELKAKSFFPELEEEVLRFWDKAKIFEQSVTSPPPSPSQGEGVIKDYVFYDGPPFATGLPHYGHIVASLMKDVVPRYWTMRGFRVERKWGWDCHGLPIENIAEKELGFKRKQDIIEYGIDKFNEFCRSKVLSYVEDWKVIIRRLGRWADMENDYKTMDLPFMESVWWVFKQLWDKGLIYESYRSIHICPRCETTLSQQEVTEGYKEGIKDLSATVKFELVDEPGTFVLAWTTTPWTLIGNTALAVGEDIEYQKLKFKDDCNYLSCKKGDEIIIANDRHVESNVFGSIIHYETAEMVKDRKYYVNFNKNNNKQKIEFSSKTLLDSSDLVGKKYKPLFDYYLSRTNIDQTLTDAEKNQRKSVSSPQESASKGWKIYAGDFVSTEDGTGIVHIAPAFGEDDLSLSKEKNLPFVQHLGMDGVIKSEAVDFAGLHVKPIEDVQATDKKIVDWLDKNNKLFKAEQYEHNYPHCWRCETPLLNYVTASWFVKVLDLKPAMLKNAKEINWSPEHIKEGRWGKWLLGARDWSISRQRFWASVMPLWRCQGNEVKSQKSQPKAGPPRAEKVKSESQYSKGCGHTIVFGSVSELEQLSGEKITDLHKHIVDNITFKCERCQGTMTRVPDVLDTWFDSGSMPYAQMHYPFENKEKFEANFPAEFIAEGPDQTRAWFYYLHVLATAIQDKPAFKNVIVNGIVLASDGKKMSKRLNNYTDPAVILEQYGADAIRYYLLSSSVMMTEDLNFSDQGVVEALRKNLMVLWNVYKFYELFTNDYEFKANQHESNNILDKWIVARLNQLIGEVTKQMNAYNLPRSVRPIGDFINDLSTWYLRRSRERFKSEDKKDKEAAITTTKYVLIKLSKVMAPFMPFIAEQIWQKVTGNNFQDDSRSVHLEAWPSFAKASEGEPEIIEQMVLVRKIVEAGLAARDAAGMKIRQALPYYQTSLTKKLSDELAQLIKDELNILELKFGADELGTELTEELKLDGVRRELVRSINNLRKNGGLTIADRVAIYWSIGEADFAAPMAKQVFEKFGEEIKKDTLADSIEHEYNQEAPQTKEVKINGETVWLGIKKM